MDAKILMQDLAAGVSKRSGLLKKDSDTFVRLFFETIEDSLSEEKNVKVKGLGSFKIVEVSGRDSVNVNTGERIHIKGHSKITFTPDTGLRNTVNRPFADFETVILNEGVDIEKMEYTGEVEAETPEVTDAALEVAEVAPEVADAAPEVVEVVEEPTVEEPVAEEPAAEEPAVEEPAAEEPKVEEPVVEEPTAEEPKAEEPVAPAPAPAPKSKSIWKYVACAACIAVLAVLGYCFGTGKLSLEGIAPTVAKVEKKTDAAEAQKPVAKVDPVKADSKSSVVEAEPEVAPFDSATVNDRFPYGAYEICGIQCTHVVAEGEDIESIAKQYLKSKSNKVYIAAMNDINTYKPVVEVGQELIIPEIRRKASKKK